MPLVEVEAVSRGGPERRYLYRVEYSWLPSYSTIKRYFRRYPIEFRRGRVEIRRLGDYYTYQWVPYGEPPRCMLIINPYLNKIYTTEEELRRLMKDYKLSREEAIRMCQTQAVAFLNLIRGFKERQYQTLPAWWKKRFLKYLEKKYPPPRETREQYIRGKIKGL